MSKIHSESYSQSVYDDFLIDFLGITSNPKPDELFRNNKRTFKIEGVVLGGGKRKCLEIQEMNSKNEVKEISFEDFVYFMYEVRLVWM